MFETSAEQRPDNHHQQFIKERIPQWLTRASPRRRLALKRTTVGIPEWYKTASAASHAALAQAVKASWVSQAQVDRIFEDLANVRQFAEPLLLQALKERFGIEVDVTRTYLRLYLPKGILLGYQVKTLSLLDAALRNFEAKEKGAGYFDEASCFISEPSVSGQFDLLAINQRMSVSGFVSMCRELDIGGQYTQQLEALLLPKDAVEKAALAFYVKTSQKDAFRAAVLLARMKGDIGLDSQVALLHLLDGGARPDLGARVLRCHHLQIMEAKLIGIMLLTGDLKRASSVEPVVVYIPDDPQHPIKEYPSTAAFRAELTSRLSPVAYQRFFARFVAHEQRGYFFAALNNPLTVMKWDSRRIQGDPWTALYHDKLNKILNDARVIAVPTADQDRQSRWETWDSLENVASIVLQVATLVALPFVPFLGELMLAYTAYQLLDETFTGILDWAEGQVVEAADHLLAIAEDLAQLGAFVVAGAVAGRLLTIQPSTFVDGLKPVVLEDGRSRLWNPDLKPYERDTSLPAGSMPDELGLHHHAGTTFLPLEGNLYEVGAASGEETWDVRHPQRANAYRPRLTHNGEGAWAHEVERPMEWQGAQLFRRLGHSVAEFSDVTARRILAVSGVDEAMLRHLHVHQQRPPALLKDTIRRFKVDQQIQAFRAQMESLDPAVYARADTQLQLHLLKQQQVSLSEEQLRSGNVIQSVVETLEEGVLKKLLGLSPTPGDALPGMHVRAALLRSKMARWAQQHRAQLFATLENSFELSADTATRRMRRIFPRLPRTVAEELWFEASAADRLHLHNRPGMSRRMAHEALFYLREVRLSRAYEGLYLQAHSSVDTDLLALRMLETLDGWSPDVRIEVRDVDVDGALRDSIGRLDAPIRKVLVRQNGQYETYDEHGEQLHGLDDLFGAVQHALPQAQRESLGLPHVGQRADLEQAVRQQVLLPRSMLRELLGQPPLEPGARSPMGLAMGRSGYLLGGGDIKPVASGSIEQRLRSLFPTLAEEELETLRRERSGTDSLAAVARLENEYMTLVNDLEVWVTEVPTRHPVTDRALTAEESAAQGGYRASFIQVVQASWRRRLTTDNRFDTGRFFSKLDIIGDLPQLSADFSHVSEFILINRSAYLRGGSFLKSFTGLKSLTMRGIRLDTFPIETFQMRSLISLALENCNIRLTEATVEGLAHMENLEELDVDNNPLGLTPHVGYMKKLERLQLKSTGLTETPYGLFDLEKLTFADLTSNQIVEVAEELFEVPDTRDANYNFCGNPLSAASKQRIAEYNNNASIDRRILIQLDEGLAEDADNEFEFETESDESGVESGGDSSEGDD